MINYYLYHNDELDNHHLSKLLQRVSFYELEQRYDYSPILHIIRKSPKHAFFYARDFKGARWLEAEKYIMKDSYYAYCYAAQVMMDRWPVAEPYIRPDPYRWKYYCTEFKI